MNLTIQAPDDKGTISITHTTLWEARLITPTSVIFLAEHPSLDYLLGLLFRAYYMQGGVYAAR